MNALGGGLRIAWALEEAQLVLFPSHLGYRTSRSFRDDLLPAAATLGRGPLSSRRLRVEREGLC